MGRPEMADPLRKCSRIIDPLERGALQSPRVPPAREGSGSPAPLSPSCGGSAAPKTNGSGHSSPDIPTGSGPASPSGTNPPVTPSPLNPLNHGNEYCQSNN